MSISESVLGTMRDKVMFCFSYCFSHKNVHLCHIGKDVASTGLGLVRVEWEEKDSELMLSLGRERGEERRCWLEHSRQLGRM